MGFDFRASVAIDLLPKTASMLNLGLIGRRVISRDFFFYRKIASYEPLNTVYMVEPRFNGPRFNGQSTQIRTKVR